MRKILLIFLAIVFLASSAWAWSIQDRLKAVIARKNAGTWWVGADFHCGWETGTGGQNTSPISPEDAWTAINSDDALTKNVATPLDGTADILITVSVAEYDYVTYTFSDQIFALRFRFKLLTDSLPADEDLAWIMIIRSAVDDRIYIKVDNESGQFRIYGRVYDGVSADRDIGSPINISINTEYQIELFYDGVATTVGIKVWDEDGGAVGTAERTTDMTNETMTTIRFGVYDCTTTAAQTKYQLDNFYFSGSATTYLGPES